MNPVVLAAIAISLVSLGTVSMASIASQQAVGNANLQKTVLERDRLAEQVNAYISSVTPSGPDTVATVKNTGSTPVTIDHCLVLAPPTNNLRPTATKITSMSGSTANPGSTLDITIAGTVAGDDIKCVTSKGTVLPVKLDGANAAGYSVADDIGIYSVSARVVPGTKVFTNNASYKPPGIPSPDYSSTPAGSLTWSVPVISQIMVSQILRYDSNGTPTDISSGLTGPYTANSQIRIPITSAVSKVVIKYTNSAGIQNSANIYPQTVARLSGSSVMATSSTGVQAGQRCTNTNGGGCNGAYLIVEKYVYLGTSYSPPAIDPNDGQAVGLTMTNYYCIRYYCVDPTTLETGGFAYTYGSSCSGCQQYYTGYRYYAQLASADYQYYYSNTKTLNTSPEIVDTFSFPAPAPSFTVSLSFSRDASISGYGSTSYYGVPSASTYTRVDATNFSASNILPGSISVTWPGSFKYFTGSEHRDGTYQFRIENVQAGQQVQVRVAHGVLASMVNPHSGYYNGAGWYNDSINPTISGSTTFTISQ